MLKNPWIYSILSLGLGLYMLFAFPNLTWLPWLFIGAGAIVLLLSIVRLLRR